MNLDTANSLWKTQTDGDEYRLGEPPAEKQIPQFSAGNGGRLRLQGYFSRPVLQALVVIGRSQIAEDDNHQTPKTPPEAFAALQAKKSGYFKPHLGHAMPEALSSLENLGDGSLEIDGETTLVELEAAHLLWSLATDRDATQSARGATESADAAAAPEAITPLPEHASEDTGMGAMSAQPVGSYHPIVQVQHLNETAIVPDFSYASSADLPTEPSSSATRTPDRTDDSSND